MSMDRRSFVVASGITAGAAVIALAGCSGGGEARTGADEGFVEFDLEASYLPLGSVVVLDDGLDPEVKRIVTARRPLWEGDGERVYDYAAYVWPLGQVGDVGGAPLDNEVVVFDASAVKGVVFVGYAEGLEKTAADSLAKARESGASGSSALLPLAQTLGVLDGGEG